MKRYLVTAMATYEVIGDTPEDAEHHMRWLVQNASLRYELTVHDEGCAHTRTGGETYLSCLQDDHTGTTTHAPTCVDA